MHYINPNHVQDTNSQEIKMRVLSLLIILSVFGSSFCDFRDDTLCANIPPGQVYSFPYPGDCSRYIRCEDGIATVQICSSGLWFSESLQECVSISSSDCVNLVCPPGIVDFYPYPSDCHRYIECYHGSPIVLTCPAGLWFHAGQKRCVNEEQSNCGLYSTTVRPPWTTPTPNCQGVLPGQIALRPHPGDCAKFIRCDGAEETVMSCPAGLYFNADRQMCIQRELSDCDDSTGTGDPDTTPIPHTTVHGIDDPRCYDGNNDYWPHPDCSKFIACYQGQGHLMDCPTGLHFNPDSRRCENPSEAHCGRTEPTVDPDTTTRGGEWTPDPDCPYPSSDTYLFPYPGDCTRFFECWNGRKEVLQCPDGLHFNPTLLVCDYPYQAGCRQ